MNLFSRKPTTATLVDQYLAELSALNRSPQTTRNYRAALSKWIDSGLTPKAYLYQLPDRGMKPSSVNQHRSVLRAYHNWLTRNGHAETNPVTQTQTLKVPSRLKDVLTVEEVARLIDACDSLGKKGATNLGGLSVEAVRARLAAMIAMQVTAGLRVSELCKIKIGDVDMEERWVTVIRKGDTEQRLRFGKVAQARILLWGVHSAFLTGPFLFCGLTGASIATRTYTRQLAEACWWASIPAITPHALRRTFATLAVDSGIPIIDVRDMLGHAHVQTTELYVQRAPERAWRRYDLHVLAIHERTQHELRLDGADAARVKDLLRKSSRGTGHAVRMKRLRELRKRQLSSQPASSLFSE